MTIDQKQLKNNVEEVLDEYLNGMEDYPDEYPEMTIDECREYVTSIIYDIKSNGRGITRCGNGICDNLKFLGNEYIYSVIDEYAKGCGIIKSEN